MDHGVALAQRLSGSGLEDDLGRVTSVVVLDLTHVRPRALRHAREPDQRTGIQTCSITHTLLVGRFRGLVLSMLDEHDQCRLGDGSRQMGP